MGHYNTVKAGDPFRPSAGLENEVRRFFNGGATISGGKSVAGSVNNSRISATNRTSAEIPVFRPVAIFYDATKDCFHIKPATASDDLFGITTEIIPPNSSGTVVLSGVVNAVIFGGTGAFASPGSDGKLTRSSSGRAQILYEGTADKPGIVLLGGGGGVGSVEYNGYHKMSIVETQNSNGSISRILKVHEGGRPGGSSLVFVNNIPFYLEPFEYTLPENPNVSLFIVAQIVNNELIVEYKVSDDVEQRLTDTIYFLIGRVRTDDNGSVHLFQDFTNRYSSDAQGRLYATTNGVPILWLVTTYY